MIGKIIRMNRARRRRVGLYGRSRTARRLRESLFALTRYIVDADPYKLVAEFGRDVVSITDYAFAVEDAGVEPGEKVEAHGTRNLYGADLADFQSEMLAVAARAPRAESPLLHIILSLQAGESWKEEQREEAIDILLDTLGLEHCQVLWAEHSNTDNAHLHLSIVRVDPQTGHATGSNWLIDDLHQALALIEERQGRTREPGALYVARAGVVYDSDTDIMVRDASGRFISGWYKALGRKHDRIPGKMRPMRASIIDAAQRARSWPQLHEALGEVGVRYDRSGSGGRISFGADSAKASQVHESLSLPQLEEKLGIFEPDLSRLNIAHEAYRDVFDRELRRLRVERDKERQRLRQWSAATVATMPSSTDRDLVEVIRLETAAADESLVEAFRLAISRYTKHRLNEEAWEEAGRPAAPPPAILPALLLPAVLDGRERKSRGPSHLARLEDDFSTDYRLADGARLFTDHHVVIVVHAPDRVQGLDEALQIAAARWGSVTARGPAEYLNLVADRAAALGIEVRDEKGVPLLSHAIRPQELARRAPAQPSASASSKEPELADDPVQRARIDAAIGYLRNFQGLPIRRRPGPKDVEKGGRSGDFEIVLDNDPNSTRTQQLSSHAVFDEDERVQKFLRQAHAATLEACRGLLLGSGIAANDMSRSRILECLPKHSEARYPVYVAYEDFDFQKMLSEVREHLLELGNEKRLQGDARFAYQARDRALEHDRRDVGQLSVEGVSVEDQEAYRERQAAQQR